TPPTCRSRAPAARSAPAPASARARESRAARRSAGRSARNQFSRARVELPARFVTFAGSAVVGDGLDVVAVGVEEERGVVAAVVAPLAGRAVVDEPCVGAGGPEGVDRRVVCRSER